MKKTPSKTQREIMDFVKENGVVDLDEILELTNAASKASLQFTIRAMITKGLIEKLGIARRRGRSRQTFGLASGGVLFYDPRTGLSTKSVDNPNPTVSDFPKAVIPVVSHHEKFVSDFLETPVPELFLED